ncbi:MAG: peptidylprolyl isomerase [Bacteroidaceae bacterium]|nr:peptidylprolyl isomerase [Bacteroidaceae bacterium]
MTNRTFKKYITLIALALVGITGYAQNNTIDEVIWVVGDEAILKSEVEEERLNAQYEGRKWDGDPDCVIPEQLAIQKLYLHQAAIDSIEVTESDVMRRVELQLNWLIQQVGSLEKLMEYKNMTAKQIREQLHDNIKDQMIIESVQRKLVGSINVTPAEVRRYFKNMPEDSIPFIPTHVEVQIITNEPKIPQTEIDRIKDELRNYTDRVYKGEMAFSTLARLYSEDKESARQGGELGYMGRGELVPEFANVAFNLTDPKTVSKIVESEYGFHIIQLIDKRGDRVNVRHILRKPQVSYEDLSHSLERLDSIADDIRSNKFTFDDAAMVLSSDKETKNNHGILSNTNMQTGVTTSRFEMRELPQEIARVVEKMNIGEISKAFTMINKKGKDVCAIVKLKARTKGHRATMTEDFQALKNAMLEKLRAEKLDNWIREKQKTTYFRINDNYKNCSFKYPGWIK